MPTSNLSVTSSSRSGSDLTCWVNPNDPLYIYELIIKGIQNLGNTTGSVRPGVPTGTPVVHTIYVDANDPVLNKQAPFTLSLTYDANYKLIGPIVASLLADSPVLFDAAVLVALTDDQKVTFVSQVLQATATPANPPAPLLINAVSPAAVSGETHAKKLHGHHPTEDGNKHP